MPGPTRRKRPYIPTSILSDDQLIAIGRIAVEAAELDSLLEWVIWQMLQLTPEAGQLFTTGQALELKIKTFIRVAQKTLTAYDLRHRAASIAAQMRDSSRRRNDVIHALWSYGPAFLTIKRTLGDKGVTEKIVPSDVISLLQIAADIHSDFLDLLDFLIETVPEENDAP